MSLSHGASADFTTLTSAIPAATFTIELTLA
jgi:hypothetical protein